MEKGASHLLRETWQRASTLEPPMLDYWQGAAGGKTPDSRKPAIQNAKENGAGQKGKPRRTRRKQGARQWDSGGSGAKQSRVGEFRGERAEQEGEVVLE